MYLATLQTTFTGIDEEIARTTEAVRLGARSFFSRLMILCFTKNIERDLRKQARILSKMTIEVVELTRLLESLESGDKEKCAPTLLKIIDNNRQMTLEALSRAESYGSVRLNAAASSILEVCKDLQNALIELYQAMTARKVQTPAEIERELDEIYLAA
jgi:hypothetical protein